MGSKWEKVRLGDYCIKLEAELHLKAVVAFILIPVIHILSAARIFIMMDLILMGWFY